MKKIYFYYRTNWCSLCPRAGSTQMRKVNIKTKWKKEWKKKKKNYNKNKFQRNSITLAPGGPGFPSFPSGP